MASLRGLPPTFQNVVDVPPFEQGEEIENNTSEGVEGLPDNFEEEEVEGGLGNPKDDEIIGNSDLGLEIVE